MRQFQLAKARTCVAETKEQCHLFFGCQWDITQQLCVLHNEALSGETEPYTGTTEDLGTVDTQTPPTPVQTQTTTSKPADPEPQPPKKKKPTDAPSLQSSMNCLMKNQMLCVNDMECYWDARQICLPIQVQTSSAAANPPVTPMMTPVAPTVLPAPISQETEQETEGETESELPATIIVNPLIQIVEEPPETETESETEHESPPSPSVETETESESEHEQPSTAQSSGVGPETETETESESESGLTPDEIQTTDLNICFFYPDRESCILDDQCFWDRRTSLCASLLVPNFLPTDCEEFLYQPSCTKDKRCIWKSGECEWANLDCEDMDTKKLCVGAKYNGVPCVWSDHEQECDEAPVFLSKAHTQQDTTTNETTTKAYFQYLWVLMLLGPAILLGFALGKCTRRSKSDDSIQMDSLLLDNVNVHGSNYRQV